MITVDEDKVERVAIRADFPLHICGLRVALEEAPLMTEHEVVDLRSDILHIDGDLLPGRQPR